MLQGDAQLHQLSAVPFALWMWLPSSAFGASHDRATRRDPSPTLSSIVCRVVQSISHILFHSFVAAHFTVIYQINSPEMVETFYWVEEVQKTLRVFFSLFLFWPVEFCLSACSHGHGGRLVRISPRCGSISAFRRFHLLLQIHRLNWL